MTLVAVAAGGALGAVSRFLIGEWARAAMPATVLFPFATLGINIVGSFVLGVVSGVPVLAAPPTPTWRAFVAAGVCGGFTTFSAFSGEVAELLHRGAVGRAGLYIAASVVAGVAAFVLGAMAARAMLRG